MMKRLQKNHRKISRRIIVPLTVMVVLLQVFLPTTGFSQTQSPDQGKITVDGLRTHTAPGFILLGVAPSSVEHPTTPKALGVSLVSATKDTNFLQRNYALEVAPYWLFPHSELTFDDYYNAGIGQSMLQNFSLSIATAEFDKMVTENEPATAEKTISGTGVGVGFRTLLLAGIANPALEKKRKELLDQQIIALRSDDAAELEKLKALALEIQQLDKKRVGWLLELAGAVVVNFPGDAFEKRDVARWGVWITPAYRFESPLLDFIVVGRYIRDEKKAEGEKDLYDVGGRLLWQLNKDLGFSAEAVRRFNATPEDNASNRISVNFEYLLAEGLYLTASFGKDFNQTDKEEEEDTLVVLFGINFGLGEKPSLKLKKDK